MEPVDKVTARTDALRTLGLTRSAGADDIRKAWRSIAFHAHPDHADGDHSEFSQAKIAYDFLRKEGLTGKSAAAASSPRRPKLKKRVIDIGDQEIAACRGLLNADPSLAYLAEGDSSPRVQGCEDGSGNASDHVPDAIGCFGRDLTYFVPTPVCQGANRVALPTYVLASQKRSETEVLAFQSKTAGSGEIIVPDTIRERRFPGAKSVRIRFAADQFTRDEFWLAG